MNRLLTRSRHGQPSSGSSSSSTRSDHGQTCSAGGGGTVHHPASSIVGGRLRTDLSLFRRSRTVLEDVPLEPPALSGGRDLVPALSGGIESEKLGDVTLALPALSASSDGDSYFIKVESESESEKSDAEGVAQSFDWSWFWEEIKSVDTLALIFPEFIFFFRELLADQTVNAGDAYLYVYSAILAIGCASFMLDAWRRLSIPGRAEVCAVSLNLALLRWLTILKVGGVARFASRLVFSWAVRVVKKVAIRYWSH